MANFKSAILTTGTATTVSTENNTYVEPIGVSNEIKPKGGIMGELERMALHDPSIGKSKRSETPKVVSAVAN